MKRDYLEWALITAGSAIVGALAVDAYRKYRAKQKEDKLKAAKPKEILIIEEL
jgi:uncharacterized membrane protein YebE (DUF533 family)